MAEKTSSNDKGIINIIVALNLQERRLLKGICMEVLGNYKWKTSKKKALVLNKILDKLEEVRNKQRRLKKMASGLSSLTFSIINYWIL